MFEDFAAGLRDVEPDSSIVQTDDQSDVEWLTDRMVFAEAL